MKKTPMNPAKNRKSGLRKTRSWVKTAWQRIQPDPSTRKGAGWAVLGMVAVTAVTVGLFIRPGFIPLLDIPAGIFIALLFTSLVLLGVILLLRFLFLLPRFIGWIGLFAFGTFLFILDQFPFSFTMSLTICIALSVPAAVWGGTVAAVATGKWKQGKTIRSIITLILLFATSGYFIIIAVVFFSRGSDAHLASAPEPVPTVEPLDAPNPAEPGPHTVLTLTYGSGTDRRRPEFGQKAELKTESVDAKAFIKNNKGWKMKLRQWYWGFDFTQFPVNGRVWFPQGEGPFPLVLCVHGNHKMEEHSDPGYGYLGELLASRGFIFVSVDENFFNGSWISGLSDENDGRAWMLLQHLKVWHSWNRSPSSLFFTKVDTSAVGLIGHSRGGEAAAIAGAFNRLSRYPEDATIVFDFGFNIEAIIAIAPCDGQYQPAEKPTPLENVHYLVLQGAHDADVSVFAGSRQYGRVRFTDDVFRFKTSLYSYRSNHGQFNTVWGNRDIGLPIGWLLNVKPLLEGEEQRTIGKIYISAFLEAALRGRREYVRLFRDHRCIASWLPDDIYVTQFQDSHFRTIADFDEDVDVTTATLKPAFVRTRQLAVWREEDVDFRGRGSRRNNAVFIGWREADSAHAEQPAPAYRIEMPGHTLRGLELTPGARLSFSIANTDEKPPPEEENGEEEGNAKEEKGAEEAEHDQKEDHLPELDVELADAFGNTARIRLGEVRALPPLLKSRFTKLWNEDDVYGKDWEITFQTVEIPLDYFLSITPLLDVRRLQSIRFLPDRAHAGVIVLDDVGFAIEPRR